MQPAVNSFDTIRVNNTAIDTNLNSSSKLNTYIPQSSNKFVKTPYNDTVLIGNPPKMSRGKKTLIGVGVLTVGALACFMPTVTKRADYVTKAMKTFQETFMRNDISKEETISLLKEYKEILKIADKDEFLEKLLYQAKKNFGLSHLNFKIEKLDLPKRKIAAMSPDGTFSVNKNLELDKDSLINIIFHELRHAKQNELMCSKDVNRYLSSIYCRSKEMIKKRDVAFCDQIREMAKNNSSGSLSEKQIEEIVNATLEQKWMTQLKNQLVDKLGLGKLNVPKELNDYIENCFKAHEKYSDSSFIGYFFNFLEKDARKSGERMRGLLKSIPDNLE